MLIRALNSLTDNASYTQLSVGEASGVGTVRVKNINNFFANWAVQLGNTGEELAEIKLITGSSPSGTSLVLTANTTYSHPTDTTVWAVKFDKVIFKRSTSGTAGTATALTDGTVSITPDNAYTVFDDTTGASTYAYKVTWLNSVTSEVSGDSDWLLPAGNSFYSLASLRDRAKNKLFSAKYLNTDDVTVDTWINEWLETMTNAAIDVNQDYLIGTTTLAFSGTTELGTITATDFKELRRVWLTTNGSDYYAATKMSLTDFIPQQTFNSTHPYFYMVGDNVVGRKPNDTSATASVYYYKMPTQLSNDSDELPVSMRSYTRSFVDYALSQAYLLDNKTDLGDRYAGSAELGLAQFRNDIAARSKTGPTSIKMVEAISGDDF